LRIVVPGSPHEEPRESNSCSKEHQGPRWFRMGNAPQSTAKAFPGGAAGIDGSQQRTHPTEEEPAEKCQRPQDQAKRGIDPVGQPHEHQSTRKSPPGWGCTKPTLDKDQTLQTQRQRDEVRLMARQHQGSKWSGWQDQKCASPQCPDGWPGAVAQCI